MIIPSHVRKRARWLRFIPFFSDGLAFTIYPYIFLPSEIYEDLISPNPSVKSHGVLLHEEIHLARQKMMGTFRFGFYYVVSKTFRFNEELNAMKAQMSYHKENNEIFDIEKRAAALSGITYLWATNKRTAQQSLLDFWESLD